MLDLPLLNHLETEPCGGKVYLARPSPPLKHLGQSLVVGESSMLDPPLLGCFLITLGSVITSYSLTTLHGK